MKLNIHKSEKPKELTHDEENATIIPEGYLWCDECMALTPHEHHRCVICGQFNDPCNIECPRCGAEEPDMDGPWIITVQQHSPGCHHSIAEYYMLDESSIVADKSDRVMSYYEYITQSFKVALLETGNPDDWYLSGGIPHTSCRCPKVPIYPKTNVFNYKTYPGNTMICTDAEEWTYDVRCHVCGHIYEVEDGNC